MKSILTEKWLVCRICLKPKEPMNNIFDKNADKDLTRKILECGGVPIKRFDHYPDKICLACYKLLRFAHKFRVICQRSHQQLSKFIAPVEVEKCDVVPTIELEEVESISLKIEPDEMRIKQEVIDDTDDEIVDTFQPMEEAEKETELEADDFSVLEEPNEQYATLTTDDVDLEYLEEIRDGITSDEEFFPNSREYSKKTSARKQKPIATTAMKDTTESSIDLATSATQLPKKRGRKKKILTTEENSKPTERTAAVSAATIKSSKIEPKQKRTKESSFICDICGNVYPSSGRLTEHIKLHKGIKPYDCEICGHAFAQTQQLARHMNTHTGNRPYKCVYCPAAFADLSTRNKHHRIHTNERPYVCDVCGKAFTYTNTLKFHKMIHTGEKPHVCDICGKGFQQAYKLRNHKMTHVRKGTLKMEKFDVDINSYEVNTDVTQEILNIHS